MLHLDRSLTRGLAEFGQVSTEQQALIEKLLADQELMHQMLVAGGAKFNRYGSRDANLHSLFRLLVSITFWSFATSGTSGCSGTCTTNRAKQSRCSTNAPTTIDPVKRYLHYEKAYTAGELDPAFKDLTTWEYRMYCGLRCLGQILAWGPRDFTQLSPDHIYNADYGWRYYGLVRTDVSYGSENVKCDLANLHNYQNIIMNGGVCGRRAFFGTIHLASFWHSDLGCDTA